MQTPLRVFIGYDSREPIALAVCAHSINRRASAPVTIIPLNVNHLKGIYTRGPNGTTEFSLTRFLVPYLSNYEGVSIFMDCDMLVQCDIYELFRDSAQLQTINNNKVTVCKHDYEPKAGLKATGIQTSYPKKNWSSFMVFNNSWCRSLTPAYVNSASPADLHRFVWAGQFYDGSEVWVGDLPLDWNWLVGEYESNPQARNLHFTLGTPCFAEYRDSDCADLWFAEYAHMNTPLVTPEYAPFSCAAVAGYPVPPRTI